MYQYDPKSTSLNGLRETGKIFRRTLRKPASQFCLKTSASIQAAADKGDTKSVHHGIRKAVGPTKKLTSPMSSA